MRTRTHGRHRRTSTTRQENVSILSHSAICLALSGMTAFARDCTADNFN